jgi:O-antigen ligase
MTLGLMFVTAPTLRARARIVSLSLLIIVALVALLMVALSFDAIGTMFYERAKLVQYYDAGTTTGRFDLQRLAFQELFDHPFGIGPYTFARVYGLQQHNVYLHAFLVYGWAGGIAYLTLVLLTIGVGLRAALVATPWQPYMIAALAAFFAVAIEGAVIDTDHWRTFYLQMGLVWGLFVATERGLEARRAPRTRWHGESLQAR